MARTIEEIKDRMTADFMRNADVARAYGFEVGAPFYAHFSRVSIESLLFYVVAGTAWVLENLFDRHRLDVEERIDTIMPHRPKWYRDKVLCFMKDKTLIQDTDRYDTAEMTEADIQVARVVRYAAATENAEASILTIKVATGENGALSPLDSSTEAQLLAYINEIKDAGVRINLVNQEADLFHCEVDVYYDAMLLPDTLESQCRNAIHNYIENLPFNGEYSNMALVDELQKIEGVRIVEMSHATTEVAGESTPTHIDARFTPAAGYFSAGKITINMKSYQ